jgi:guanyl-specific ribonuclease Sa
VGGLLGGATNGITALVNGKTFWSGNVKPPPMTPATIRPELPSLNSSKPELNTEGMRSRPLEMTPERPVFSETLEPGPITVKLSSELREVEIATRFVSTADGVVDLQPTLNRIATGGKFPHVRDGSTFFNNEGLLPIKPAGYYREFVHPTFGMKGAGLQRIITGQNGQMWFTPNHYKTFIPIR